MLILYPDNQDKNFYKTRILFSISLRTAFRLDCTILCQNGDSTLLFQNVRVHGSFASLLTEIGACALKDLVHKGRFSIYIEILARSETVTNTYDRREQSH